MTETTETNANTVKPGGPDPSWSFFLDDKPKLKSVFDNVRNYLICATLFGIAAWFRKEASTPGTDPYVAVYFSYAFIVAGVILAILNFIQSVGILGPAIIGTGDWFQEREHKAARRWKWLVGLVNYTAKFVAVLLAVTLPFMIIGLIRISFLIGRRSQ